MMSENKDEKIEDVLVDSELAKKPVLTATSSLSVSGLN